MELTFDKLLLEIGKLYAQVTVLTEQNAQLQSKLASATSGTSAGQTPAPTQG